MKTASLLLPVALSGMCGGGSSHPSTQPELPPLEYEECEVIESDLEDLDNDVEYRSDDSDSDDSDSDDSDSDDSDSDDSDSDDSDSDDSDSDDSDSDDSDGDDSDGDDSDGDDSDDEVLPIELLYFNGTWDDDRAVVLRWATASEINVSHFEVHMIEPCADFNFDESTIATTVDSESPAVGERYSVELSLTSGGTYYFRLVEVTIDGTNIPHDVIAVRVGA